MAGWIRTLAAMAAAGAVWAAGPAGATSLPAPGWLAQAIVAVGDRMPGDAFAIEGDVDGACAGYWAAPGGFCNDPPVPRVLAEVSLPGGASGRVEVDAAAGTIRARTQADYYADALTTRGPWAYGRWDDEGTVGLPAGWSDPTIPTAFLLEIDGGFTDGAALQHTVGVWGRDPDNLAGTSIFHEGTFIGEEDPDDPGLFTPILGDLLTAATAPEVRFAPVGDVTALSPTEILFRLTLPSDDPYLRFRFEFEGFGRFDFSSTSRLSILLPEGAVYRGASGRTAVGEGFALPASGGGAAPVPGPATGLLLATAMAAMGAALVLRRGATV